MNVSDSPAYLVTDLLDSMTTYTTYTNTTAVPLLTGRYIIRGMYMDLYLLMQECSMHIDLLKGIIA